MTINRAQLKQDAKNALGGKWGLAIGVAALYELIITTITTAARIIPGKIMMPDASFFDLFLEYSAIGNLAGLLFGPPLMVGLCLFFLHLIRQEDAEVSVLFSGFDMMWKAVGTALMILVFIFLWSLLFIVPGIIAAIRYSMAFYILADNPNIGIMKAISESKRLTAGHKMQIFVLGLSFLGWILVCALTAGIGFFWLAPYMQTTYARLYDQLKSSY